MQPDRHGYREIGRILVAALLRYRLEVGGVLLAGMVATGAQAVGLLALVPVLNRVATGERGTSTVEGWIPAHWSDGTWFLGYMLVITTVLMLSVSMRRLVLRRSYAVARRYVAACAVDSVLMLARLQQGGEERPGRSGEFSMNRLIPGVPTAWGMLFVSALHTLNEALLMVVLLVVLFVVAPWLAMPAIVLMLPFLVIFVRRLRSNTDLALGTGERQDRLRQEKKAVASLLEARSLDDDGFQSELCRRIDQGVIGQSLRDSFEFRHRVRGLGMAIDQLGPLAVLIFGIMLYLGEDYGVNLVDVLIGYLILRLCIGSLSQLADSMAVVNRVYPGLRGFIDLREATRVGRPGRGPG